MEFDLSSLLGLFKRNFWILAAVVTASSLAAGVISYQFIEPKYEAKAKLIANSSNGPSAAVYDLETIELNIRLIKIYKEIILTSSIVEIVSNSYPELDLEPEELLEKLEIELVPETPLMNIRVEDSSYHRAVGIVDAVTTVFMEQLPIIMNVSNVSILNQSQPETKVVSISPNAPLNIVITFFSSFLFTMVWLLIKERLDETIKSEEDIQKELGIPALGTIVKWTRKDLLSGMPEEHGQIEREGK